MIEKEKPGEKQLEILILFSSFLLCCFGVIIYMCYKNFFTPRDRVRLEA
tara:strand:- start:281 stop:427 length:147 start_codon:yes stop_codon:yes gene_type:complete